MLCDKNPVFLFYTGIDGIRIYYFDGVLDPFYNFSWSNHAFLSSYRKKKSCKALTAIHVVHHHGSSNEPAWRKILDRSEQ